MVLSKIRKLFIFSFCVVLSVCTFLIVSSADEIDDGFVDPTPSIQTGIGWRLMNFVPDSDTMQGQYISVAFIKDGSPFAYFHVFQISTGKFLDGQFYLLQSNYDSRDNFQYFDIYGSLYPNGLNGDYTSIHYSLNSNDYILVWFGDPVFDVGVQSYINNAELYFDYFQPVNFSSVLGGLGYQDGYSNGYNDGYDIGYNDGVLVGDVSLSVGENSVYINPSELSSRFYIKWRVADENLGREVWYIIFGDSESIFYVQSDSGEVTDSVVLSTLYTRDRGWLSGYGPIINLPLGIVYPSRYATIFIPGTAVIYTDRDNLVGAISLFDYNVLNESFISSLGEVYRRLGYDDGFEVGDTYGYDRGYSIGYGVGYGDGHFDGVSNSDPSSFKNLGVFLVDSVGSFLETDVVFGISVGNILALVVGASLFFLLIRLLR